MIGGRLLGVEFRVSWLLLALIALAVVAGYTWTVLLAFLAVTAHELAHVGVARALGLDVGGVELLPYGGRAELVGLDSETPAVESVVAIAGPAASLVLALVTHVVAGAIAAPNRLATLFIDVNVGLALINLLPAAPLDGGRLFRALRAGRVGYQRAEADVRQAGQGVSLGLGVLALILAAFGITVWQLMALALFLFWASRQTPTATFWAVRDLAVRQSEFLTRPVWAVADLAVREDALVRDVLHEMRPRHLHRVAVLDDTQRFRGILWERELLGGLAELGPGTTAGELLDRQN